MKLIASKSLNYGTRRLKAGQEFDATSRDAIVLTTAGLARSDATPVEIKEPIPELSELRASYEALSGRKPDNRWGAVRLACEIRDLRTEQGA